MLIVLYKAVMCHDHVQTEVGLLWTKVDSIAGDLEKLKLSVPQQASQSDCPDLRTEATSVSAVCTACSAHVQPCNSSESVLTSAKQAIFCHCDVIALECCAC